MSNIIRYSLMIFGVVVSLNACTAPHQQATIAPHSAQPSVVNCQALKRQEIYNQTNMNTETNTTTLAQHRALQALIAQHCQ